MLFDMRYPTFLGLFLLFSSVVGASELNAGIVAPCPTTDPAFARAWSELTWSKPDLDVYQRELEVFSEGLKRLEEELPDYDLSRCCESGDAWLGVD